MIQKIITPIKRLMLYFVLCTLYSIPQITSAQSYENFITELETMGIDVTTFINKDTITRYELTRLLNAVECQDCIHPSIQQTQRYTNPFRSDFIQLPGKDFDDILFQGGRYQGESYYYCVAYVGDNEYMRGYPDTTSPICAGLFCGARNTNNAEFIQVVVNLLSQYIYQNYRANRSAIQQRANNLIPNSYADRYLDAQDRETIAQEAGQCPQGNCMISSPTILKTYIKYCMFNLSACEMRSFGQIGQAYWPVAELNILYNQNIIDAQRARNIDIYSMVDGKTAIDKLYKLYSNIQCTFDDDYDCDGIPNAEDNCPYDYNPSQKDTDGDGIGDVCDDDIDGDGIPNPIGIVDDTGRINIRLLQENKDNCIFIANPDQSDTNNNKKGDTCEDDDNFLGMYLATQTIGEQLPITVTVDAITRGTIVGEIQRDMGDGTTKKGPKITHTYRNPGVFVISADAQGIQNKATATTTIVVGQGQTQTRGIQIQANRIHSNNPSEITFSTNTIGDIDSIQRDFGNNIRINRTIDQSITRQYAQVGSYAVVARAFKGNSLLATSRIHVSIGAANRSAKMISIDGLSIQNNQAIRLQTTLANANSNEIKEIQRDFGDGTKITNKNLTATHIYRTLGARVINQTIVFNDNTQLTNFITVYVSDPIYDQSFSKNFAPSVLIGAPGTTVQYSHSTIGANIQTLITHVQRYTPVITQRYQNPNTNLNHRYNSPGVYYPSHTTYINQCIFLESQTTVVIKQEDICQEIARLGTTKNYCDMDNDGVPDICDDDIDGDGVKNLIGLVLFDNPDCSIDQNNINWDIFTDHFGGICALDNCPFDINTGQEDLNRNGIGDMCEERIENIRRENINNTESINRIIDTDGDGIPDAVDVCPTIPENYNGIEDMDGCPEIGVELACPQYITTTDPDEYSPEIPKCPENTRLCGDNVCKNTCDVINPEDPTDTISNERPCNNNGICDPLEGCECPDCFGQADRCQPGLACGIINNNNVCLPEIPKCPENTRLCGDNVCKNTCDVINPEDPTDTISNERPCNNNGICDPLEGCECPDCFGQADRCQPGLACGVINNNNVCLPEFTPPIIPTNQTTTNCTDPTKCITTPTITTIGCNQCPCQFADFRSDLIIGDRIRAGLRDQTKTTLYRYSPTYIITE